MPFGDDKPKQGGSRDGAGRPNKLGVGGHGDGLGAAKTAYNTKQKQESRQRAKEPVPAKKTRGEKVREQNKERVVRLAERTKIKTSHEENMEDEHEEDFVDQTIRPGLL